MGKANLKAKKGQIEILFLVVIVFAFALVAFIGHKFLTELNNDIQSDGEMTADAKAVSADITARYPNIFDAGIVFFLILVWIAIVVSAYFIDTHPVYFVASLFIFVITIIMSFGLTEGYDELITDAEFMLEPAAFPMVNFVLNNLGLIVLVVGFSVFIVLYGKSRNGGAYQ